MSIPSEQQVQQYVGSQNSNPLPTPSSPTDILEKMVGFGQQGDILKLAQQAATPIPGGHSTQMPATLAYQPKVHQPGQLDATPQVGAGNARAQGIGNSVIGVMNMIGKLKTAHDNKKRLQLATDTATLINMQQDVDQAKQYMNMLPENDPRRKQYQGVIDSNMQKMNAILADDKTRKAIGEGFKIDFTNPKEMTDENHAVMQGKQMAEQQSNADKFMQQTPQSLQPNLPAQAQYQAAAMQQKVQAELARSMMTYMGTMARVQGTIDATKMREIGQNAREEARLNVALDITNKRLANSQDMQDKKFAHDFDVIRARGDQLMRAINARQSAMSKDDYDKTLNQFDADTRATETAIKGYIDSMSADVVKNNPALKAQYQNHLTMLQEQLKLTQIRKENYMKMFGQSAGVDMSQADALDKQMLPDSSESVDSGDVEGLDINNIDKWANMP